MPSKKTVVFFLFFVTLSHILLYKYVGSIFEIGTSVKSTYESYYELIRAVDKEYFILETYPLNSTKVYQDLPVIVKPRGGIGNQLFHLACAYSLAKKRKSKVYIQKPKLKTSQEFGNYTSSDRAFSLHHFRIPFTTSQSPTNNEITTNGPIFKLRESHIWEKSIPERQVLKLQDLCISEIYFQEFRDEIKEMFELNIDENPIRDILEQVNNSNSVAVHVRQGDYLSAKENRTLPITFQKSAINWMNKLLDNPKFFVFSDDIEFAKKEFKGITNVVYVDNRNTSMESLYDFLTMSKCKHNIIANSTFSWWAAYLNKNEDKIVIGPMPRHPPGWNELHYNDKTIYKYNQLTQNSYLYPKDWLTFNPWV